MARWAGEHGSLGRARREAVERALHILADSIFEAAVIIVRVNPGDDQYQTAAIDMGDPAVCAAIAAEFAELEYDEVDDE